MLVAPYTTWFFAMFSPPDVRTMPVPALSAFWYFSTDTTVTMPFCSAAVASETLVEVPPGWRFMSPGIVGTITCAEPAPLTVSLDSAPTTASPVMRPPARNAARPPATIRCRRFGLRDPGCASGGDGGAAGGIG